jgi:hypothetical protein
MSAHVEMIGIYPVIDSSEPCHLIELWVRSSAGPFDIGQFTQPNTLQPRENCQVAYDEKVLDESGATILADGWLDMRTIVNRCEGDIRMVFFLHYLNPSLPILTPFGEVSLPMPTEMPARLSIVKYESPC